MKRPLLLTAVACCGLLASRAAAAGTLEVRLDHLRPEGSVQVALYRDALSWRQQRGAYAERSLLARQPGEVLRFDGLPPGRYAVGVRQDASNAFLLQPLQLALPRHGDSGGGGELPASFAHAAISVGEDDPSVLVHLYTDSRY